MPHTSCDHRYPVYSTVSLVTRTSDLKWVERESEQLGGDCERTTDVVGIQLGLYLIDLVTWIL